MTDFLEMLREEVDLLFELDEVHELRRAANRLLRQLAVMEPSAEVLYFQGLVAYEHPDYLGSLELQRLVEVTLTRCLTVEPPVEIRALALLGLGHHFYDSGAFVRALDAFETCDSAAVDPYLVAKIIEMRLCCQIHVLGVKNAADKLASAWAEFVQLDADDVVPLSLARLFDKVRSQMDPATRLRFQSFARDVDRLARQGSWLEDILNGVADQSSTCAPASD